MWQDRYDVQMFVTPNELRDADIPTAKGGFHKDAVDDMLERAADTIEDLQRRISEIESAPARVAAVETPGSAAGQPSQELIQRTLLLAQKAADDAIAEARAIAKRLIEDADTEAQARRSAGIQEATAAFEMKQRGLESEIGTLTGHRDSLMRDVAALDAFHEQYESRIDSLVRDELQRLQTRPHRGEVPSAPALESIGLVPNMPSSSPAESDASQSQSNVVVHVENVETPAARDVAEVEPLEAMIVDARDEEDHLSSDEFVTSLREAVRSDGNDDLFSDANRAEYRDLF